MPVSCIRHAGRRCGAGRRIASFLLSGLTLGFAPASAPLAETAQLAGPAIAGPHAADIGEAAHRFGIPVAWIVAVLDAESDGDPRAVSPAGAMGLMQLMPATWDEQRALHRLGGDPFQPRDNILAGTAYLRAMWDRYGNIGAMLAAYNAGPGRYDEYLAGERELPLETRDYVAALAPVLGGEAAAPGAVAGMPRVTDWREAPLFVTAPTGADPQGERAASAQPNAPAAPPESLAPAAAEAIFVARPASGGAP